MDNEYNIRYFDTLRKSLKDGARAAVMNANSENQIDRIQRLYQSKDDAIKDCAVQYMNVQELGDVMINQLSNLFNKKTSRSLN